MKLAVRYFASIREALGPSDTVDVAHASTVAEVRDALIARDEPHARVLARGRALRCALNKVLCDETTVLAEGDELAFFPPVTGG